MRLTKLCPGQDTAVFGVSSAGAPQSWMSCPPGTHIERVVLEGAFDESEDGELEQGHNG